MSKRIEKIMNSLPNGIDAGFIISPVNRRYILDFSSSAGVVIVTKDKAYFIVDFRYIETAKSKVEGAEVILQDNLDEQIQEIIKKHNIKTIAMENDYITISEFNNYENICNPAKISANKDFNNAIMSLRKSKDEDEKNRIREAQKMTDQTFLHALEIIKIGKSEREIALDMEFFMRKLGADGVSFDFIVLAGANSSMPHGVPGDTVIKDGDFVLMDFGAKYNGYRSDMTRTVGVGNISDKQKEVYDIVLKAQLKALDFIKSGVSGAEVDKVARDYIYDAGYEGKFGHGLGHSVGIEIHESPRFSHVAKDEKILENTIMTVEPGIYLPGEFGVRIEDMGSVTSDGFDNFTKSKKELIIL